jgi:hypothetical protein
MSTLPFTCSKPAGESRCFAFFVPEFPLAPYALRLTARQLRHALCALRFAIIGGAYASHCAP